MWRREEFSNIGVDLSIQTSFQMLDHYAWKDSALTL